MVVDQVRNARLTVYTPPYLVGSCTAGMNGVGHNINSEPSATYPFRNFWETGGECGCCALKPKKSELMDVGEQG